MNIILLGITSFLNDISSEMILPILPLLITSVGGTGIALGLIGGLRDSAAEVLKFFFGHLSDSIGKRKIFVYWGYITSAFFKVFLIMANSWQFIFALVGLERLGKALRTAPRDALITQTMPKNIGKGFGIHRAFDTLGAIGGSILVFFLVWKWNISLTIIILIAAAISLTSAFPLRYVKEEAYSPQTLDNIKNSHHFSSEFKLFVAIAAIFSLSHISYMFFIVHAQQELTMPSPILTSMLLYVLFNIFYTLGAIPFGILSDKIGRWTMMVTSYILFVITLFGFMLASTLATFMGCFILYGIALAIIQVNQKAYASDLSPAILKATALGFFESITGIAMFISSLLAGILWDRTTHHNVFLLAGILAMIAAGLLVIFRKKLIKKEPDSLNFLGNFQ